MVTVVTGDAARTIDRRFVLAIVGVEVWRIVVLVVHANHDAQEATYLRHQPSLLRSRSPV